MASSHLILKCPGVAMHRCEYESISPSGDGPGLASTTLILTPALPTAPPRRPPACQDNTVGLRQVRADWGKMWDNSPYRESQKPSIASGTFEAHMNHPVPFVSGNSPSTPVLVTADALIRSPNPDPPREGPGAAQVVKGQAKYLLGGVPGITTKVAGTICFVT